MQISGCTAVLTGAGSGIGRALAVALAQQGCHLALVDIDPNSLDSVAAELAESGVRISQHALDVADRQAVAALPAAVMAAHPAVDLLINNAGVALGGTFERLRSEDFDWLMAINFDAVVSMTRAFLPLLKQRPKARIVNLSSLFGLITPAGQTAYCASKFAVRGFSHALRMELLGTPVGVSVVHPGGVATAIADSARLPEDTPDSERRRKLQQARRMLRLPPSRAATIILRGIQRDRARILVGHDARLLSWLERLLPSSYWRLLPPMTGERQR